MDKQEQNIATETPDEVKRKLREVRMRLQTLEWDKTHNQLNSGMEAKYLELKQKHDTLTKQLSETQA